MAGAELASLALHSSTSLRVGIKDTVVGHTDLAVVTRRLSASTASKRKASRRADTLEADETALARSVAGTTSIRRDDALVVGADEAIGTGCTAVAADFFIRNTDTTSTNASLAGRTSSACVATDSSGSRNRNTLGGQAELSVRALYIKRTTGLIGITNGKTLASSAELPGITR